MKETFAQKIFRSGRPFVLYHTHEVTRRSLKDAIDNRKSMDLDICMDESGELYLGHSVAYYSSNGERPSRSLPIRQTLELLAEADIPIILDCKDHRLWHHFPKFIEMMGPDRCLVHSYVEELRYTFSPHPEVICAWAPAQRLKNLKDHFPQLTTTASAAGLPSDLFRMEQGKWAYSGLLGGVRSLLMAYNIDTVCLNIPSKGYCDRALAFFTEVGILPHINVDTLPADSSLTGMFAGETDSLSLASQWNL